MPVRKLSSLCPSLSRSTGAGLTIGRLVLKLPACNPQANSSNISSRQFPSRVPNTGTSRNGAKRVQRPSETDFPVGADQSVFRPLHCRGERCRLCFPAPVSAWPVPSPVTTGPPATSSTQIRPAPHGTRLSAPTCLRIQRPGDEGIALLLRRQQSTVTFHRTSQPLRGSPEPKPGRPSCSRTAPIGNKAAPCGAKNWIRWREST